MSGDEIALRQQYGSVLHKGAVVAMARLNRSLDGFPVREEWLLYPKLRWVQRNYLLILCVLVWRINATPLFSHAGQCPHAFLVITAVPPCTCPTRDYRFIETGMPVKRTNTTLRPILASFYVLFRGCSPQPYARGNPDSRNSRH